MQIASIRGRPGARERWSPSSVLPQSLLDGCSTRQGGGLAFWGFALALDNFSPLQVHLLCTPGSDQFQQPSPGIPERSVLCDKLLPVLHHVSGKVSNTPGGSPHNHEHNAATLETEPPPWPSHAGWPFLFPGYPWATSMLLAALFLVCAHLLPFPQEGWGKRERRGALWQMIIHCFPV